MGARSACIAQDKRGGTENPAKPNIVFETCCYERLFGGDAGDSGERVAGHLEEALRRDAELVYMADTFWLPADTKPTTLLEKLVKSIFDFHTKDLPRPLCHQQLSSDDATLHSPHPPESNDDGIKHAPASSSTGKKRCRDSNNSACGFKLPRSGELKNNRQGSFPQGDHSLSGAPEAGAEWWVQVREEGHHSDLGMPFHWDKDEQLMEQEGVVICPTISTVTYLTDFGAPTAVLEFCATGATGATGRAAMREGGLDCAFLSYPALFKHLAFPGSFLHGVPEPMLREGRPSQKDCGHSTDRLRGGEIEGDLGILPSFCDKAGLRQAGETGPRPARERRRGRTRVTLLVNVWLNHKPSGIAQLPAGIAENLSGGDGYPPPCFERSIAFSPVPVEREPLGSGKASARVAVDGKQPGEMVGFEGPKTIQTGATINFEGPLGPATVLELRFPTPERLSTGDWKGLHSFALSYGEGCSPSISSCSHARPDLGR